MTITIDEMATFCKRKGFVYPSSELYGGLAGFFDYGPYGVELKRNIAEAWWRFMVRARREISGIDGAIISPEAIWRASGHLSSGFADVMLACTKCKSVVRADVYIEERVKIAADAKTPEQIDVLVAEHKLTCPACGSPFAPAQLVNLMFPLTIGAQGSGQTAYLRGETTQMIYLDFKLATGNARLKPPCGLAQIGKAFRNEISPRNFLFRCREFEQMEMQYFIHASEEAKWFDYWKAERLRWWRELGIDEKNLRTRAHAKDELAHYAKQAEDIEYRFPFGWKEVEGVHNRGDWDLTNHAKHAKAKLDVFDEERGSYTPHIIETSAGLDRAFLTILFDAYEDDAKRGNIVLHLHPRLAPISVAILPLVKKGGLPEKAQQIHSELSGRFSTFYDESGSIGRRYARQDELGTPWCVTIDFESLEHDDVTIRDRDSCEQIRIPIPSLGGAISAMLRGEPISAITNTNLKK